MNSQGAGASRPNIFDYHDYRVFLRDWFDKLKGDDPSFSLRSLCKRCRLGSGHLANVLSGRRALTAKLLLRIQDHLGLNYSEISYLGLLRELSETRSDLERKRVLNRIEKYRASKKLNPLDGECYQYLSKWYYVVVRELARVEAFQAEPNWICERLGGRITLDQARECLDFLKQNGFIEVKSNNRVTRNQVELKCNEGLFRVALGEFHRGMLDLAKESIQATVRNKRLIAGYTVTISPERLSKIKKVVADAQSEIAKIAGSDEQVEEGAVYHFVTCLFPLTDNLRSEEDDASEAA